MSIVVVIVVYLYSYSCPYYLCHFYDAYRIICMIAIKKAAISAASLELAGEGALDFFGSKLT